jgi:predicted amidophosphoribosyltransferase
MLLGSLVQRPALYSRNAVTYVTARSWRSDAKRAAVAALKQAKKDRCCATCGQAIADVAHVLRQLHGPKPPGVITSVPCGHSRVPDCFGRRLAEGVAAELGVPYVQLWRDRFVTGVSHPKEFDKLPPLEWIRKPKQSVIVIDDVATSGWHLEEALTALRGAGVAASAIAWIGGTRGAGRDSGKPEAPRSIFGGRGRGWLGGN